MGDLTLVNLLPGETDRHAGGATLAAAERRDLRRRLPGLLRTLGRQPLPARRQRRPTARPESAGGGISGRLGRRPTRLSSLDAGDLYSLRPHRRPVDRLDPRRRGARRPRRLRRRLPASTTRAGAGLFLRDGRVTTEVAAAADCRQLPAGHRNRPGQPPTAPTSLFVSAAELTGYPRTKATPRSSSTGRRRAAGSRSLTCVSCNPTGERPEGSASIPGAVANGEGRRRHPGLQAAGAAADGSRVFFESDDSLSPQDTNGRADVYEWEAAGAGDLPAPRRLRRS